MTPRVRKMVQALDEAHLKPVLSRQILLWIITHYAAAAGLTAGILSAGSAARFVNDSAIIRTTICAIREGFSICLKVDMMPRKRKQINCINCLCF